VDEEINCYSCRRFGYLARNYRNQEIVRRVRQGRRVNYENNRNNTNNLNRKESLIVLD